MTIHTLFYAASSVGLSLLFLCAVFIPLERVFSAKPGQKIFRPAWFTDLCFLLGQYLIFSGMVFGVMMWMATWIDNIMPAGFRASVAAQPWWLQIIEVIVLSDVFVYWGHRMQHRYDFLWRFHSVHHTAEHLDWLAAHREHPIDSIYTIGLINLPAFILGIRLEPLVGFILFRGIWAIFIHSNVRLSIGPLRMILGAPELHHWHHDKNRDAGNYANLSPLMDIIFGTYHCPDHEPESYGVRDPIAKSYLGQLIYPMLPRKMVCYLKQRFSSEAKPRTEIEAESSEIHSSQSINNENLLTQPSLWSVAGDQLPDRPIDVCT